MGFTLTSSVTDEGKYKHSRGDIAYRLNEFVDYCKMQNDKDFWLINELKILEEMCEDLK